MAKKKTTPPTTPRSRQQKRPSKKQAPQVITLETWRGAPCLDFNMLLFFAHAPLDDAAAAFVSAFGATSWDKDVFGKDVTIRSPAYLAYQFNGHPWTTFDHLTLVRDAGWPHA